MKEFRDEIITRLETLIKEKADRKVNPIYITTYANSYYFFLLQGNRPIATIQVFRALDDEYSLIDVKPFSHTIIDSEMLKLYEEVCEQLSNEIKELPSDLIIVNFDINKWDSVFDYLYAHFGYVCASYDEETENNETILTNIKWVVKEEKGE